jgi:hypothetical protein
MVPPCAWRKCYGCQPAAQRSVIADNDPFDQEWAPWGKMEMNDTNDFRAQEIAATATERTRTEFCDLTGHS